MSDRTEQAGAHAEARTQTWTDPYSEYADGYVSGHMAGVEWADVNPQPHTITRGQLAHSAWMLQCLSEDRIAAVLPGLLGIEVEDDDE